MTVVRVAAEVLRSGTFDALEGALPYHDAQHLLAICGPLNAHQGTIRCPADRPFVPHGQRVVSDNPGRK
jgi:hypothetical protein